MWSFLKGKGIQHKTFWNWKGVRPNLKKWNFSENQHLNFPECAACSWKCFNYQGKRPQMALTHRRKVAYLWGGDILQTWKSLIISWIIRQHIVNMFAFDFLMFFTFLRECTTSATSLSAPHHSNNAAQLHRQWLLKPSRQKIPSCSLFFTLELCSPPAAWIRADVPRRRYCW